MGEWCYCKPDITLPNEASTAVFELAKQKAKGLLTFPLCADATGAISAITTTVLLLSPQLLLLPKFSISTSNAGKTIARNTQKP